MRTVTCTSKAGALLFDHASRDGGALLFNSDLNNTVWLGKDASISSTQQDNVVTLSPQSWIALDGEEDVYGVCQAGQSVIVNVVDGGQSFFQSGITSGAFRIGSSGLFIYGTSNPHTGTPPLFSATPPGVTADPFGNPVVQDAVSTYNAFGAVLNVLSMAKGGFFQYQDNGSAVQGLMILSILSVAGVDPVNGTTTRVGQFGQNPFGEAINVIGDSISLFNAFIAQATGGRIKVQSGSGAVNPFLQVDAPEQGVAGHMQMLMQGTSPDGTQPGQLVLGQASGAGGLLTTHTQSMLEVQGNVSGISDPVETIFTLAAPDGWIGARIIGDPNNRFKMDSSNVGNRPKLRFGPGSATFDTFFYNPGVGLFATSELHQDVSGSAEVWHLISALGYANGWLDGTDAVASYKLIPSPDNAVSLCGSFKVPAGAVSGQTIATLTAAYRPNSTQIAAVGLNRTSNTIHVFQIGSAGVLAFRPCGAAFAANDIIDFSGIYYLDR